MIETLPLLKKEKFEEIKNRIEKTLNCKIKIKNDLIEISGNVFDVLKAKKILNAFNNCFEIEDCIKLIDENYDLIEINVKEYSKKASRQKELIGRVIGTKGKVKNIIEEYTQTKILIKDKDKKIFILGKLENIEIAKNAIEMILEGKKHSTVFNYLDKTKKGLVEI